MSRQAHLFKVCVLLLGIGLIGGRSPLSAAETVEFKKNRTGLFRDVFDQNIYYEGTNYLHLERLYRDLFNQKVRSRNVNVFDEVPDSAFFTNRHARQRLSEKELEAGYHETNGPDLSGPLTVVGGKAQGLHPGFCVKDLKGDRYLLKFDPVGNFELATSAEVITSRFYYAIGYNVPQYTVAVVDSQKLVPDPEAEIYADTGFKEKLTPERFEEYLRLLPQDREGNYRASASKILSGEDKGNFSFQGRREKDPDDKIQHKDRREIRALWVFSSWLNNYDARESNTLDMLVDENGNKVLKHYLIDFNAALGAGAGGAKPPMFVHEHILDFGEAFKAFLSLGWWEKPWQRRWREAGEQPHPSPAVGYFDNRNFDPGAFKTQLPYYTFKDLTRADGYWAAKIVMSFSDDDIRTMVRPGQLSNPEDERYIAQTLIERRDLIGRYWFEKANPLEFFDLKDHVLIFVDLGTHYGFWEQAGTLYRADVIARGEARSAQRISFLETPETSFQLGNLLTEHQRLDLLIRTKRPHASDWTPYVRVELDADRGVAGITHED